MVTVVMTMSLLDPLRKVASCPCTYVGGASIQEADKSADVMSSTDENGYQYRCRVGGYAIIRRDLRPGAWATPQREGLACGGVAIATSRHAGDLGKDDEGIATTSPAVGEAMLDPNPPPTAALQGPSIRGAPGEALPIWPWDRNDCSTATVR